MRVLQISNYYQPEIGGIEKIAQAISTSFNDKNDVRVVCFTHENKNSEEVIDGVKVTRIGTQIKVASQQLSMKAHRIIKRVVADFNPNIIVIHAPNPFLESILLRVVQPKTKVIVYWHSDIVKQKIGEKLFHHLTIRLLKRATCIVATSPNYIDGSKYLSMFRKKCIVIPNCIDEKELEIDNETEEKKQIIQKKYEGKTLCVCVGRQVPYKGFEYAVEAFKRIGDDFRLVIIGRNGSSTKKIRKIATGMKNVEMVGEADYCTLKAYLAACDVFCFPSITKNEAFGIALAEGMYFGKPTVTYTIPGSGVNYVSLNGVTGIEVENRNVEMYANAIKCLSENDDIRKQYGENGRARVKELFLESVFEKKIQALLYKVNKK